MTLGFKITKGIPPYSPNMIMNECDAIAEVIVEVSPPALCAIGTYLLNPEACGPLFWLTANPAHKKILKKAVNMGCQVIVESGPEYYKIILYDTEKGIHKIKKTFQTFSTPSGMWWLQRYIAGFH